jgi:nucleotide-binding universal stress UspA family protein
MELWIATDLSPTSEAAVAAAFAWARGMGAKVVLLHVVHDPELAPALTGDVPGDVAKARAALERAVTRLGEGLTCRAEVLTADDVAAEIVKASAAADYLFLGSHGRSGFDRLRLGSVAMSVLRHATVPLVCLPARR